MPYFELTLNCAHAQLHAVEQTIERTCADACTMRDAKDQPIYEPKPGEMPLWDWVSLTALYSDFSQQQLAIEVISSQHPELEIIATELDDQVWERLWMDHFKPSLFGQQTWVVPVGYEPVNRNDVNLLLDPGLAFGTGTHPTTALCLEWIDGHIEKGSEWVDFGCGSGILAVAAALHGASTVNCIDIDPQAIEATLMNAKTNRVHDLIHIVEADQIKLLQGIDGIIANILAAPLMQLEEQFYQMLKPQGCLVLSGILTSQIEQLQQKYAQRFVDIEVKIKQDWALLFARKEKIIT